MEPDIMEPVVEQINSTNWFANLLLCAGSGGLIIFLISVICRCVRKQGKKKHNFGIKKPWSDERTFLNFKKPTPPITNPDKGSHYLKKSPSPTGNKSSMLEEQGGTELGYVKGEEGVITSPVVDCDNNKSLVTVTQQVEIVNNKKNDIIKDQEVNEDDTNLGKLFFTVKYSFDKNALIVTINKCTNLPVKDTSANTSDPYVKLQLLPEKQHKVKTRVVRRTLNPVYDEDFTFYGVHYNQLPILTLHFVVLSFDRYSRDDVVGEVMVELGSLGDLANTDKDPKYVDRPIAARSEKLKHQGRGELLVSLCYQPAANRVTAVILKARNLPKMDITGLSDPYVKIYLMYNGQRISKKKTHVKKRTLNPVFNESFVFDLPKTDSGLSDIQLEFMLLDWDRVTKNEVIGRLGLGGPDSTDTEIHHWKDIQASPRRQIAQWHKLRE